MKRILIIQVDLEWDTEGFKNQSTESLFRELKDCISYPEDVKITLIREDTSNPNYETKNP
jgi:hypothetical protein